MVNLLKTTALAAGLMLLAGTSMAAPDDAYGQPVNSSRARMAQPGAVNYVEGSADLDGHALNQKSVGSAVVGAGHVLATGSNGKVEMLLTPGVFFRLGPNSSLRMISPSLSDTRVELVHGRGMMEVVEIHHENHLQVNVGDSSILVKSHGVYEFTADPPMARVYDGKAEVTMGSRTRRIGKSDEVAMVAANPELKTTGFDLHATESADDLYAWSKLRADYTAEANMSAAENYYGNGVGLYGAGWYWNPYYDQYAFLLSDGFLWSPFGFGYFSPAYWGTWAPYYGWYGGRAWYGRPWHGVRGRAFNGHPAITRGSAAGAAAGHGFRGGAFRGTAPRAGGFHSAPAMGGFHGGFHGGGFHGGRR